MTFKELVEQRKIEARRNNLTEVRADIHKAWVQEKITKFCNNFDGVFTPEDVSTKILEDDMFATFFIKDPSKQNITEKLVEECLRIKKLPASGNNCVRFDDKGNLVHKSGDDITKSADFKIGDVYYTQKYTREAGGAQDNQRKDVVEFLKKGSIHHKVGAILDGDYWDNFNRQELCSHFKDNDNVIITCVDELRGD